MLDFYMRLLQNFSNVHQFWGVVGYMFSPSRAWNKFSQEMKIISFLNMKNLYFFFKFHKNVVLKSTVSLLIFVLNSRSWYVLHNISRHKCKKKMTVPSPTKNVEWVKTDTGHVSVQTSAHDTSHRQNTLLSIYFF